MGKLEISPLSLLSVCFCTIIWHFVSCLHMKPASFIYLGLHGGMAFFLELKDMATLVLCFLAVGCQILISSSMMNLDHACTFFTQIFNFRVFELERRCFFLP